MISSSSSKLEEEKKKYNQVIPMVRDTCSNLMSPEDISENSGESHHCKNLN
jgi:hypothetical protein